MTKYTSIDLFAGAGGLALGLEQAGINSVLLNDSDKYACATLRHNRPDWNVVEADITGLNLSQFYDKVDVVTGGFPCQSFSYAGKQLGFDDVRGTLFYEYARAVKEVQPPIFVAENVRGLLSHDKGQTLSIMLSVLDGIGYNVQTCILKAIDYKVPQKRERLIIVGVRKDIPIAYEYPKPCDRIYTLSDALKNGDLYDTDVPPSAGTPYPKSKQDIFALVPAGGHWRSLPVDIQKSYLGGMYNNPGGSTGVARRIAWNEPCLTLLCTPSQKQTDRCHPDEVRPFTVREYARIQTFPDDWHFTGSVSQQYKQIGNAVPVNLAEAIGHSIIDFLTRYYSLCPQSQEK